MSLDNRKFSEAEFNYDQKKAEIPIYFVYPRYTNELKKYRIPFSADMADQELTDFLNRVADPDNFDKSVPTVMRLKHINKTEPNKGVKTEYMIWYENWEGTDANGHTLPPVSDLPQGIDKTITVSKKVDNAGNVQYKKEKEYWVYTEPWNPDRLDEILGNTVTDVDAVQFIVKGFRAWGGFTYDEFKYLSFEELQERGRTGAIQQPVQEKQKVIVEQNVTTKATKAKEITEKLNKALEK